MDPRLTGLGVNSKSNVLDPDFLFEVAGVNGPLTAIPSEVSSALGSLASFGGLRAVTSSALTSLHAKAGSLVANMAANAALTSVLTGLGSVLSALGPLVTAMIGAAEDQAKFIAEQRSEHERKLLSARRKFWKLVADAGVPAGYAIEYVHLDEFRVSRLQRRNRISATIYPLDYHDPETRQRVNKWPGATSESNDDSTFRDALCVAGHQSRQPFYFNIAAYPYVTGRRLRWIAWENPGADGVARPADMWGGCWRYAPHEELIAFRAAVVADPIMAALARNSAYKVLKTITQDGTVLPATERDPWTGRDVFTEDHPVTALARFITTVEHTIAWADRWKHPRRLPLSTPFAKRISSALNPALPKPRRARVPASPSTAKRLTPKRKELQFDVKTVPVTLVPKPNTTLRDRPAGGQPPSFA